MTEKSTCRQSTRRPQFLSLTEAEQITSSTWIRALQPDDTEAVLLVLDQHTNGLVCFNPDDSSSGASHPCLMSVEFDRVLRVIGRLTPPEFIIPPNQLN